MKMNRLLIRFIALAVALASFTLVGCDTDDAPVAPAPTPNAGITISDAPIQPRTQPAAPPKRAVAEEDPTADDVKGSVQPEKYMAKLIQTLVGFDHPKACTPSIDGRFLFVTNTGYNGNGYTPGKGSISKLEIQPDGRLKMISRRFTDGLTAPMGIAFLTKATQKFAAGTLFVCTGTTQQTDNNDEMISDVKKCNPCVTIIDPETGKILATMPTVPGSGIYKAISWQIVAPNGITFDHEGNLFIGDTGNTGKHLNPSVIGRPGIIRIRAQNIDAFAENRLQGNLAFLSVRHAPNGIYHCGLDDGIYWTTCDGEGAAGGAVYRLMRKQFPEETWVHNVVGNIGTLEGVTITPLRGQVNSKERWGGTMIVSRTGGDLMYIMKNKLDSVVFTGENQPLFEAPGDIEMHILPNGWGVLYIPERDEASDKPDKQKLRVVLLPMMM